MHLISTSAREDMMRFRPLLLGWCFSVLKQHWWGLYTCPAILSVLPDNGTFKIGDTLAEGAYISKWFTQFLTGNVPSTAQGERRSHSKTKSSWRRVSTNDWWTEGVAFDCCLSISSMDMKIIGTVGRLQFREINSKYRLFSAKYIMHLLSRLQEACSEVYI